MKIKMKHILMKYLVTVYRSKFKKEEKYMNRLQMETADPNIVVLIKWIN